MNRCVPLFTAWLLPLAAMATGELSPNPSFVPPPARAEVHPAPPAPGLEPLPPGLIVGKAEVITSGMLVMRWLPESGIAESESTIRLWGLDAPGSSETCRRNYAGDSRGFANWRCGQQSIHAVRNLIGVRDVKCRYIWSVANPGYECWLDEGGGVGRNINRWAVQLGWSYAGTVGHTDGRPDYPFVNEQAVARNHQAGVWNARFKGAP